MFNIKEYGIYRCSLIDFKYVNIIFNLAYAIIILHMPLLRIKRIILFLLSDHFQRGNFSYLIFKISLRIFITENIHFCIKSVCFSKDN